MFWNVNLNPSSSDGPFPLRASSLGSGLVPAATRSVHPTFLLAEEPDSAGAAFGRGDVVLPDGASSVAIGPIGGALRAHRLPGPVRAVAGNVAGDVAILSEACATRASGCHPAAPEVVLYRNGPGFSRAITLDRKGHSYDATLAIDAGGTALVAWDRDGSVYARFVSPSGKLTAIQRLATETTPPGIDVAIADDGRAAVGWTSQSVSEGQASSPFAASLSLAGPHHRFTRPKLLETIALDPSDVYVPYRGLVVALPDGQPGMAAWSGFDGAHFVVRAASITGTAVGAPQTVSQAGVDTVLADAAESSRGEAAILLLPGRRGSGPPVIGQPGGLDAVSRGTAAQAFGAPVQVVGSPTYVDGADLAIDAKTGQAFATWRNVAGPIGWSASSSL
ncbi:MAG TPA: hypothetical protein VG165_02500 [Solirubrobacteraceae bacterium]|nr:hypothetical protein [Solirubrobacteraceae bacterium]